MPATSWPPPTAASIVARAASVWRNLSTLAYHDSLSDGHVTLETNWTIVAPDRIEYVIAKDYGSKIIIGNKSWNQLPGNKKWIESPQYPGHQPVPFWETVTDAHLLGTMSYRRRPAWKISFFDPKGGPAWFTILV